MGWTPARTLDPPATARAAPTASALPLSPPTARGASLGWAPPRSEPFNKVDLVYKAPPAPKEPYKPAPGLGWKGPRNVTAWGDPPPLQKQDVRTAWDDSTKVAIKGDVRKGGKGFVPDRALESQFGFIRPPLAQELPEPPRSQSAPMQREKRAVAIGQRARVRRADGADGVAGKPTGVPGGGSQTARATVAPYKRSKALTGKVTQSDFSPPTRRGDADHKWRGPTAGAGSQEINLEALKAQLGRLPDHDGGESEDRGDGRRRGKVATGIQSDQGTRGMRGADGKDKSKEMRASVLEGGDAAQSKGKPRRRSVLEDLQFGSAAKGVGGMATNAEHVEAWGALRQSAEFVGAHGASSQEIGLAHASHSMGNPRILAQTDNQHFGSSVGSVVFGDWRANANANDNPTEAPARERKAERPSADKGDPMLEEQQRGRRASRVAKLGVDAASQFAQLTKAREERKANDNNKPKSASDAAARIQAAARRRSSRSMAAGGGGGAGGGAGGANNRTNPRASHSAMQGHHTHTAADDARRLGGGLAMDESGFRASARLEKRVDRHRAMHGDGPFDGAAGLDTHQVSAIRNREQWNRRPKAKGAGTFKEQVPRVVFGKNHLSRNLRDSAVMIDERRAFFEGCAGVPTEGLAVRSAPELEGIHGAMFRQTAQCDFSRAAGSSTSQINAADPNLRSSIACAGGLGAFAGPGLNLTEGTCAAHMRDSAAGGTLDQVASLAAASATAAASARMSMSSVEKRMSYAADVPGVVFGTSAGPTDFVRKRDELRAVQEGYAGASTHTLARERLNTRYHDGGRFADFGVRPAPLTDAAHARMGALLFGKGVADPSNGNADSGANSGASSGADSGANGAIFGDTSGSYDGGGVERPVVNDFRMSAAYVQASDAEFDGAAGLGSAAIGAQEATVRYRAGLDDALQASRDKKNRARGGGGKGPGGGVQAHARSSHNVGVAHPARRASSSQATLDVVFGGGGVTVQSSVGGGGDDDAAEGALARTAHGAHRGSWAAHVAPETLDGVAGLDTSQLAKLDPFLSGPGAPDAASNAASLATSAKGAKGASSRGRGKGGLRDSRATDTQYDAEGYAGNRTHTLEEAHYLPATRGGLARSHKGLAQQQGGRSPSPRSPSPRRRGGGEAEEDAPFDASIPRPPSFAPPPDDPRRSHEAIRQHAALQGERAGASTAAMQQLEPTLAFERTAAVKRTTASGGEAVGTHPSTFAETVFGGADHFGAAPGLGMAAETTHPTYEPAPLRLAAPFAQRAGLDSHDLNRRVPFIVGAHGNEAAHARDANKSQADEVLYGRDLDMSGDDRKIEESMMKEAQFSGAAGVNSFLTSKRNPTNVIETNTVERTTWYKDLNPHLHLAADADADADAAQADERKYNGLRRSAAGEGGRPAEYLAGAGGLSGWVNEARADGRAGVDEGFKMGASGKKPYYGS